MLFRSYQNNFIKQKYDRVNLTVPKGKKEKIKAAAAAEGKSVNDFINAAIDARMSGSVPEVKKQEAPAEPKAQPKKAPRQQAETKTGEPGFIVTDKGRGNYYVGGNYKQDEKKYPVVSSDRKDAKIFTKKFNAQRAIEQIREYCDMFNFEVEKITL